MLKENLLETLGKTARGRFLSPLPSAERVCCCLNLLNHPKPEEKQCQKCGLGDGITDRADKNEKETRVYVEVCFSYLLWDKSPEGGGRFCMSSSLGNGHTLQS